MKEAFKSVRNESMGLCEVARAYDVSIETLRRQIVSINCQSGPVKLLTSKEEACLAEYCV